MSKLTKRWMELPAFALTLALGWFTVSLVCIEDTCDVD